MHKTKIIIFSITLFCGCNSPPQQKSDPEYLAEIQRWHQKRIENLKSPNGWLNLAGLFWLREGKNTCGSDSSNDMVFPKDKAPKFIGTFTLHEGAVDFQARPGIKVLYHDSAITSIKMRNDLQGNPTVLKLGTLQWTIIQRGEKLGVRVRDLEHPMLKEFQGIETYPIDPNWRVEAKLDAYDPPKMISIPTVLNTVNEEPSPGALVFKIKGKPYRLDTTGKLSDKELFVIFADATNGVETYGAGRFLYVPTPGASGKTLIDFNKAYNPPCAFTEYATCPLPPEQNRLPIRVIAGEKKYAHATH